MRWGALRETGQGERRVALDPEVAKHLTTAGDEVFIEEGAGLEASFSDADYRSAGATIASPSEVMLAADVVAVVRMPDADITGIARPGQVIAGLIDPLGNHDAVTLLADRGVTLLAFELLPRTLSRAQSMDALSSQASIAGYRAAIVAAAAFDRYLPMMITASGTARPGRVLVIGAGVAGLQSIATMRRLGAVVTGYDVRPGSRGEVESLGATFETSAITAGAGEGGYARAMTVEEGAAQQAELAARIEQFDIVITTAKVPGRMSPVLISEQTIAAMRAGSVCVDLAASERGGNVAGSRDGHSVRTAHGVTVIGGGDMAAQLPTSASQMYARNIVALVAAVTVDGRIGFDLADELQSNIVIAHQGRVTNERVRAALTEGIAA